MPSAKGIIVNLLRATANQQFTMHKLEEFVVTVFLSLRFQVCLKQEPVLHSVYMRPT
jgi:hypothetical protein